MSIDSAPAIYSENFDWNDSGPYDFVCPKCGIHFKGDHIPTMMCAVLHRKGDCCHYGYHVANQ